MAKKPEKVLNDYYKKRNRRQNIGIAVFLLVLVSILALAINFPSGRVRDVDVANGQSQDQHIMVYAPPFLFRGR